MACLASARVSNEENYLMQKFARAVLKTPNIDHCARLCHASTVVGLAGAFGSGAMTQSIADIAESKCLLIIGSNTFETHPLIGRRVMQAKAKGAKVIYADPRFTPTGKQADLYLPFYSGTDVAILNCFMQQILKNGWENKDFVAKRTKDFEKVKEIVMKDTYSPANVSKISGIPEKDLITAAEWFGKSGQSAILYSMGITQHTTGVDNVKSIANIQMLTGNLGRPGTGICALRGQNNVQGACDMGALANVYSGYQSVIVPEMRKKMMDAWGCEIAEGKVGLTVTKLINVLADEPGKVKCVYIMGENPMISDPDLHHVEKGNEEYRVHGRAGYLPDRDGPVCQRCVYPQPAMPRRTAPRPTPSAVSRSGEKPRTRPARQRPTGRSSANWPSTWDSRNSSRTRVLKKSSPKYPRSPRPTAAWTTPGSRNPKPCTGHARQRSTREHPILHKEKFTHPDGLGIFTPIEWKPPAEVPDKDYPLILTTGRCIWQWHTGTMTRRSESLEREEPTGWVEINPEDAKALNIKDKEMVKAITRRGEINVGARVTPNIKKGEVFIPFHYGECAANTLTNNALDPVASIPEFKACSVRIEKIAEAK